MSGWFLYENGRIVGGSSWDNPHTYYITPTVGSVHGIIKVSRDTTMKLDWFEELGPQVVDLCKGGMAIDLTNPDKLQVWIDGKTRDVPRGPGWQVKAQAAWTDLILLPWTKK